MIRAEYNNQWRHELLELGKEKGLVIRRAAWNLREKCKFANLWFDCKNYSWNDADYYLKQYDFEKVAHASTEQLPIPM